MGVAVTDSVLRILLIIILPTDLGKTLNEANLLILGRQFIC